MGEPTIGIFHLVINMNINIYIITQQLYKNQYGKDMEEVILEVWKSDHDNGDGSRPISF